MTSSSLGPSAFAADDRISSTSSAKVKQSSPLAGRENVDFNGPPDHGAGDLSLSSMNLSSSPDPGTSMEDDGISRTRPRLPTGGSSSSSPKGIPGAFRRRTDSPSQAGSVGGGGGGSSLDSDIATGKDWKPSRLAARRESFGSVTSAPYFSADDEDDIGEGNHDSFASPPRKPIEPTSSPPEQQTTVKKGKGKAKADRLPPISPTPIVTPRKTSLRSPTFGNGQKSPVASVRSSSSRHASFTSGSKWAPGLQMSSPPLDAATFNEQYPRSSSRSYRPDTGSSSADSQNNGHAATPVGLGLRRSFGQDIASPPRRSSLISRDHHPQAETSIDEDIVEKSLLQRWILSIGVVNFDLEKGPELETLWPPLSISREERDNIAFSSFPDTSIFDVGETMFSFRLREVPLESSSCSPPQIGTPNNRPATPPPQNAPKSETDPLTPPSSNRRTREQSDGGSSVKSLLSSHLSPGRRTGSSRSHQSIQEVDQQALDVIEAEVVSVSSADEGPSLKKPVPSSASSLVGLTSGKGLTASASSSKVASSTSSSYLYGYTFFRQKRDPTIRRGYFQKSVVILTHLPYVGLFGEIVSKLAPLYFEHGEPILEAFGNAVSKWPNPSPGATLPLPLFGSVLWTALPLGRQGQTSSAAEASLPPIDSTLNKSSAATLLRKESRAQIQARPLPGSTEEGPVLASIPKTPLVQVFKEALADMWLVWECLLLAEPILVLGPDPKTCSEAVWHLLDICRPIPHAGDFRPFFTIHDYDFKNLATRKQPPAGTIIGCTNPFMAQACGHWPHVLRVGKAAMKLGTAGKYGKAGNAKLPSGGGVAGGAQAGGGGPEHIPGFTTKRKRRISKDRPLLKRLQEMVEQEDDVLAANAVLRRYFADITERFLSPLNRYISSLIPPTSSSSKDIKPFNTDAFLASLKLHGTPLPIKSRSLPTASTVRQGLYLDFLKSPNFSYYLTERIHYYRTKDPIPKESKSRFEAGGGSMSRSGSAVRMGSM